MDSVEATLARHEEAIENLEKNQRDSETRVLQQIRDVQKDMREELAKYEKRLGDVADDVKGLRADLSDALDKLRRSTPPWVGPVIGVLIAVGGWLISLKG